MKSIDHFFDEATLDRLNELSDEERRIFAGKPSDYALKNTTYSFQVHMFFWAICLLLAFSLGYRDFEQDILYLLAIVCYSKNYCDMKRDKLQIEFNWKSDIYKANVMAFARKHKIPIHEIN